MQLINGQSSMFNKLVNIFFNFISNGTNESFFKGYYRVMYDPTSWDLISSGLKAKDHDGIHLLNRAQILDDIFNFGRSGSMKYERVLEIVSYLTEEENYLPWLAAFNNFVVIERRLDEENLAIFKVYSLNKFESILTNLLFFSELYSRFDW